MVAPVALAMASPQLAWREPVYIGAGLAGIVAFALMLVQPLLAAGLLPDVPAHVGRQWHRYLGMTLLLAVVAHVLGLWLTSPPDVIDALLFRSPAPFAVWGVLAMWALFAAALLALIRKRLPLRAFRLAHSGLVSIVVLGTVLHAVLILGTMEPVSKYALSAFVAVALVATLVRRRAWVLRRAQSSRS